MSFVLTKDEVSAWTPTDVCVWLCVEMGIDAFLQAGVDGKVRSVFALKILFTLPFVFVSDIGKGHVNTQYS